MATGTDEHPKWADFFRRIKQRPAAFYRKCIDRLTAEDLYEPEDLASVDADQFAKKLESLGATAGEITFLRQAVELAKADTPKPGIEEPSSVVECKLPTTASETVHHHAATEEEEEDDVTASPDSQTPAVTVILPGTEDPVAMVKRGGLQLQWKGRAITKFREHLMPHVVDMGLVLPTLYLHFLAPRFRPSDRVFANALRAGNDNSELLIMLPDEITQSTRYPGLPPELAEHLTIAMAFLKSQAEMEVSSAIVRSGGFGPTNVTASASPKKWYFGLQTARPKSEISLDKGSFGIPPKAELYLFAQNHISVAYMGRRERAAFQACIAELPDSSNQNMRELAIFLKVFYEGGFAYNAKESFGNQGYLPRNVGIAALGVVPAFEGQSGISTGYPYLLESRFLRFADTVPVTIPAIASMSPRHGRYGLCFTRCIFVWEGAGFEREGVLDFCSVMPHGGFFYVPQSLGGHRKLGGLLYAFGEAKADLEVPEGVASDSAAVGNRTYASAAGKVQKPQTHDHRICVVCMDSDATMAIVPCGHRAYCQDCAQNAVKASKLCPVCRHRVERTMRIF